MKSVQSGDTKPELAVRTLLHRLGLRFRLHQRSLPGTPDIVLSRWRTAIFVHGCFWHQHPGCSRAKQPRSRMEYWRPKLLRTTVRDAESAASLRGLGWSVLTVWECETRNKAELECLLRGHFCANPLRPVENLSKGVREVRRQ